MCLKTPKIEKPPVVQPAPDRSTVDTGKERRKLSERQGVFNNILTSPLGDVGYGQSARKLATLGATA